MKTILDRKVYTRIAVTAAILFCVTTVVILISLPAADPVHAAETDTAETVVCDTPAEYTEALEAPDPEGSSKFALKRLMVFVPEGTITNDYGALSSIYYTRGEYYLLEYGSPSETKAAYKALSDDLGDDKVVIDEKLSCDATPTIDDYKKNPQIITNATPDSKSVSYGNDLMHLDKIRDSRQQELYPDDPVIVAVIDSGIRATHEMFQYEEWDSTKYDYVTRSRLIINEDANFAAESDGGVTNDTIGHGTHVAGIIADGTSKQIRIMPIKVLPDAPADESVYGTTDNLYPALLYAKDHGADIINMSLGYGSESPSIRKILDPLFKEFREEDNIMCVASAGNDSSRTAVYPSTSQYVESVSALKYENDKLELDWGYTNYGQQVSLAAPGTWILSASNTGDKEYALKSGTSMAAPHIAAAMAMVKFVNLQYTDYTPDELYYFLLECIWETEDDRPEGMTYHKEDPAGGYYGMPIFDHYDDIAVVHSIRYYNFKLKQKTFTYTGKKDYLASVEDLATFHAPVIWSSTGYYDYERTKDEGFLEFSWSNYYTVGTAVLGLRGIYPELIGDKYFKYTILPAGTSLTKLKGGKKALTAKWKKQAMKMSTARVDGYQIQTATNKKFTKGKKLTTVKGYKKTQASVKKLKAGKKYFARVRTYMKVEGKTYYSKWSKVKTVKTK